MRAWLLLPLLFAASSARAQTDWSHAARVEVRLSSFDFDPDSIHLRAGQPVVLHLVNTGRGGHNFAAPQFFAAAHVGAGPVRNGAVEVPGHQAVDVRLVPTRGDYRLRCTHTLHTTFGMSGRIVVD
ncbi:MAG TPA: cupredoxin domain-containing protein [Allosphingosinicella sp.]|jgi:plastocyanin|nr:cupredoxin domain-containing protein [Allosphingosinicella sp.]